MATPATRLLTLIMLLQREPNQKAGALAEQLGVSVRTLHRYFIVLEEMGLPIYSERGPHGGFSLVRGYKMPPLIFTPEEAVAVVLGTALVGKLWGRLYAEAAQGAQAKVENVLPDEQRKETLWAQQALVVSALHRTDPAPLSPLMEQLRLAIHERQQIAIQYQSNTQSPRSMRRVNPYALVYRAGWWYMVGYCHLRRAMRSFRVDRIQSASRSNDGGSNDTFTIPAEFDVHAYLEEAFPNEPAIRARLHFTAEATAHVAVSQLPGVLDVAHKCDGSVEVAVTAPNLHWLASLVLSFATWVTVLEPPALRALVRTLAEETAALYKDGG